MISEKQTIKLSSSINLRVSDGFENTIIHVLRGKIDSIFKADFDGRDTDNVVPNVKQKVKGRASVIIEAALS